MEGSFNIYLLMAETSGIVLFVEVEDILCL